MEETKGAKFNEDHSYTISDNAHGAIKAAPLGLKLRQGICAAKKAGPCTPAPPWKLEDSVDLEAETAAFEPKRSSVSVRKLAASLWESQDLEVETVIGGRGGKFRRNRESGGKDGVGDGGAEPQSAGSLRRHAVVSLIKQHKLKETNVRALLPASPASYTSSMEITAFNQAASPSSSKGPRGKLGEAGYGLHTSTELLKVLNRIWSLEEQNAANVSLIKALKVELEHARARIYELTQDQHQYRHEMDTLLKQVADDKMMRKNKEQQKVKAAVQSIKDELNDERHLRRRSESLHRKLGKELSEVKAAFSKAVKDLEKRRKENDFLEDLCDEFAESIRDYEQEVRELRQKSSSDSIYKVDRLVVHISEAWLDGRMQIKIAESQGDVAEKTTITERLQTEIETFIQTRRSRISKVGNLCRGEQKRDINLRRQSLESVHLNGMTSAPQDAEDDDSVASDLHCFELNMGAGNNEKHDRLKQNNQDEIEEFHSVCEENIDGARLHKTHGNRIGSLSGNDQGSSSRHAQYLRRRNVATAFGTKIQGQDNEQGVPLRNDAESSGLGVQHSEIKMFQKFDTYHTRENGQVQKLKSAHMHGTNCISDEIARSCSEITECCKGDHDNAEAEASRTHFSWRGQFASAGEDKAQGVLCDTASPVKKWNHRNEDIELSESVARLVNDVKENTLKAKLLEARREGRHARLKA